MTRAWHPDYALLSMWPQGDVIYNTVINSSFPHKQSKISWKYNYTAPPVICHLACCSTRQNLERGREEVWEEGLCRMSTVRYGVRQRRRKKTWQKTKLVSVLALGVPEARLRGSDGGKNGGFVEWLEDDRQNMTYLITFCMVSRTWRGYDWLWWVSGGGKAKDNPMECTVVLSSCVVTL